MKKPILLLTLTVIFLLLSAVGSRPQQIHAAGLDVDAVVSLWQFDIPNGPVSKTTATLDASTQPTFTLNVADTSPFPASGQILVGGTELMTYTSKTATSFNVTERNPDKNPPAPKKTHPAGALVQLATQLTQALTGTPAHTTLESSVVEATEPPFAISVGDDTGFGASGFLTIWHQDTDAVAVILGTRGVATEYFSYDRSCGSGNQLCLIARALQPNGERSDHPADGYTQAGGTPGRSLVDQHDQAVVKANEGFFPTGNLLIFDVDAGNNIINAELVGRNQAASAIKTPSSTEFHITLRGGPPATFKETPVQAHAAGSVVISATTHVVCRAKTESPFFEEPVAQSPAGSSVGSYLACYSQSQPNGPPESGGSGPGGLDVPIEGQPLIVLSVLFGRQHFLSTGGFTHPIFGPVAHVDTDGTTDGTLDMTSPCIIDFVPGTNLQMSVSLSVDKDFTTPDNGTITFATDTIHDATPNNGDECDDPAAASDLTTTTYIYPGDADTSDDDTDGDGCPDDQELDQKFSRGARDPWNAGDFFDANKDGSITTVDIFGVAEKFGETGPPVSAPTANYDANYDRGRTYGPFAHNLSGPDGAITVSDIFAVANQFGHAC